MKIPKFFIMFLGLLLTAQAAFAWYDPSTQRWLSRDPIGEPGFETLRAATAMPQRTLPVAPPVRWINRDPLPREQSPYTFVRNAPISWIDFLGLCTKCDEQFKDCMQDILDDSFNGIGQPLDPDEGIQRWSEAIFGSIYCGVQKAICQHHCKNPGCGDFPQSPAG